MQYTEKQNSLDFQRLSTGASRRADEIKTMALLPVHLSTNGLPMDDLAFEELLLSDDSIQKPCLFIYRWSAPVLVIGRGQHLEDIHLQRCDQERIPIIRRRTGGRAVLHHQTLNVALVLPSRHDWAKQIGGLYEIFVAHIASALRQTGVPVKVPDCSYTADLSQTPICFESNFGETLLLEQRKIFGCAQHRTKNAVLVHGTLQLAIDTALQSRVFNVPDTRIARAISCIPHHVPPNAIQDAIIQSLSTGLALAPIRKGVYHDG